MTRIALVGAPGSGKSNLAVALCDWTGFDIIDGYADEVAADSSLALGIYATYIGNLLVAGERLKREVSMVKADSPYIVCGTLVETAAYLSIRGSIDQVAGDDIAFNRTQIFSHLVGALMQDTLTYDYYFYLPLKDPETNEQVRTDQAILEALHLFEIPFIRVEDPTDLDFIIETITPSDTEE